MGLEIKKFLFDIRESIDSIENYLGDKRDFNVYMSDKMLRRAVEREFEIIWGIIVRHLPTLKAEIKGLLAPNASHH